MSEAPRIGIRREDDGRSERRVPLIPYHTRLLRLEGAELTVQSSPLRAYTDAEYQTAGARVHENLDDCHVIIGLKPPINAALDPRAAWVFHMHAGSQSVASRRLIQQAIDAEATLIDSAAIRDAAGRPLIGFPHTTGMAGLLDALWAAGKRFKHEGLLLPFLLLKAARDYEGVDEARLALMRAGRRLNEAGLPAALQRFTVGFLGSGPITSSAQQLFELMPVKEILSDDWDRFDPDPALLGQTLFKLQLELPHLLERKEGGGFDAYEFRRAPERYRSRLARWLPRLDMLVIGTPWPPDWPALLTREELRGAGDRLKLIVDLTREDGGALTTLFPNTEPDRPAYIFDLAGGGTIEAWSGPGPLVMASGAPANEMARDASAEFGQQLLPFASGLTWGVHGRRVDLEHLPATVQDAVVVYRGALRERFR